MTTTDTDVLILGGGCAGLSLAVTLAQRAPHLHVTTLEQRAAYTRDRTWCFWNTTQHPFQSGVTHAWDTWRVRAAGYEALQTSDRFRYQHLPADRFYSIAQEVLAAAKQDLLLSTSAHATTCSGGVYETPTSAGLLRSRWVFDARTPESQDTTPVFWQRFLGWHVQSEQPCFDPKCVGLMEFEPPGNAGRVVFFYTLPFSQHEALVEVTYLDRAGLEPEDGKARLTEHLAEVTAGGGYRILFEETGALPMGQAKAAVPMSGDAIPIGTRGGRIKPSSGYAFQRIQQQSLFIARALAQGQPLPSRYEPRVYTALDSIFLSALSRHPERAAKYFVELFRRVPPHLLVPFLSETGGMRAVVATMLALPKQDFIQAALLPAGLAR